MKSELTSPHSFTPLPPSLPASPASPASPPSAGAHHGVELSGRAHVAALTLCFTSAGDYQTGVRLLEGWEGSARPLAADPCSLHVKALGTRTFVGLHHRRSSTAPHLCFSGLSISLSSNSSGAGAEVQGTQRLTVPQLVSYYVFSS